LLEVLVARPRFACLLGFLHHFLLVAPGLGSVGSSASGCGGAARAAVINVMFHMVPLACCLSFSLRYRRVPEGKNSGTDSMSRNGAFPEFAGALGSFGLGAMTVCKGLLVSPAARRNARCRMKGKALASALNDKRVPFWFVGRVDRRASRLPATGKIFRSSPGYEIK
jgi:hypothetical protein